MIKVTNKQKESTGSKRFIVFSFRQTQSVKIYIYILKWGKNVLETRHTQIWKHSFISGFQSTKYKND